MTASDIVSVTVKIAAPKIEIVDVKFSAVSPGLSHSMREGVVKAKERRGK